TLCVHVRVHSLRTLINSSFGTRIGTLIWDAYPCTKLGRVSIHTIRDAYPYTQLGTRIQTHNLGRVSTHTKLGRVSIHTKIHNSSQQNHRKYIETSQNHIQITKHSQISQRFIEIIEIIKKHRNHTKPSHNKTWVGHKEIKKIHIYIYIYIYIYIQRKKFIDSNIPHESTQRTSTTEKKIQNKSIQTKKI